MKSISLSVILFISGILIPQTLARPWVFLDTGSDMLAMSSEISEVGLNNTATTLASLLPSEMLAGEDEGNAERLVFEELEKSIATTVTDIESKEQHSDAVTVIEAETEKTVEVEKIAEKTLSKEDDDTTEAKKDLLIPLKAVLKRRKEVKEIMLKKIKTKGEWFGPVWNRNE